MNPVSNPDASESVITPGGTRIERSEEFVQLLTPSGERVEHPTFAFEHDLDVVADNLRHMMLGRRFDQEATALQRKGELGLWPPALGQEAAQVGSTAAVVGHDWIFPGYREHSAALMRGIDPLDVLKTFRGTAMVDWDSEAAHFHLYSFVIGTQTLHATGYAMGMQRDGLVGNSNPDDNGAVLVHFGDGATSQGDVNEALVFAASAKAPIVFFIQNNQWAISEPIALQSRVPLYRRASGFGIPGVRVDGNDVLAVQSVTEWAMDRARRGEGPALIEAFTYRMGAHTTSDDPTKYRSRDEEEAWRAKDPIARVRSLLASERAIDDEWLAGVEREADELAEIMRSGCPTLPEPVYSSYWEHVLCAMPAELSTQLDEHLAHEAAFEEEPA